MGHLISGTPNSAKSPDCPERLRESAGAYPGLTAVNWPMTHGACDVSEAKQTAADYTQRIVDCAMRLCDLEAGWDGASAPAIDRAAIGNAVNLALRITCPDCLEPDITPTRSGNVLLSWTFADDHVEIEVSPSGRLEVLVELRDVQREFVVEPGEELGLLLAHWVTGVGLSRFVSPV